MTKFTSVKCFIRLPLKLYKKSHLTIRPNLLCTKFFYRPEACRTSERTSLRADLWPRQNFFPRPGNRPHSCSSPTAPDSTSGLTLDRKRVSSGAPSPAQTPSGSIPFQADWSWKSCPYLPSWLRDRTTCLEKVICCRSLHSRILQNSWDQCCKTFCHAVIDSW